MNNLPALIIGSALFILAGVVMVVAQIAGGFIMIPLGMIIAIRAISVARSRKPRA